MEKMCGFRGCDGDNKQREEKKDNEKEEKKGDKEVILKNLTYDELLDLLDFYTEKDDVEYLKKVISEVGKINLQKFLDKARELSKPRIEELQKMIDIISEKNPSIFLKVDLRRILTEVIGSNDHRRLLRYIHWGKENKADNENSENFLVEVTLDNIQKICGFYPEHIIIKNFYERDYTSYKELGNRSCRNYISDIYFKFFNILKIPYFDNEPQSKWEENLKNYTKMMKKYYMDES